MVGEVRDEETARTAIQAALTGHLVFSTLHTNDAISAVTRMVNMGVETYLIGAALNMVLANAWCGGFARSVGNLTNRRAPFARPSSGWASR